MITVKMCILLICFSWARRSDDDYVVEVDSDTHGWKLHFVAPRKSITQLLSC